MAWKESSPESWACVTEKVIVLATVEDGTTTDTSAVREIPPTGHPPPYTTIPIRSSGTTDETELSLEASSNNLPDLGRLEKELGVGE